MSGGGAWWRREGRLDDETFFAGLVRQSVAGVGSTVGVYSRDEAVVDGPRLTGRLGLTSIRQACEGRDRAEWRGVVDSHVRGLADGMERASTLVSGTGGLDAVRQLLRVRLYPEAMFLLAADVVSRPFAPRVVETLVVADGPAITTLSSEVTTGWGLPVDDLFALGRRQVLDAGLLPRRHEDLGDGAVVTVLEGDAFTTTHVAWLPTYLDIGPAGALVALPTRHLVMAAPLTDRGQALAALQALLVNAHHLHGQGPGAITPDVFWWRDGALALVPAEVTRQRVDVHPPAELVEVLDALPAH